MVCLKLYALPKSWNSHDAYCGPLSLTTSSGIPNREKMDLSTEIMLPEVVVVSLTTSGKREK